MWKRHSPPIGDTWLPMGACPEAQNPSRMGSWGAGSLPSVGHLGLCGCWAVPGKGPGPLHTFPETMTHFKEKIIFICNINKLPLLAQELYTSVCVCVYICRVTNLPSYGQKAKLATLGHALAHTNLIHRSGFVLLKIKKREREKKRTMYSAGAFCQFLDCGKI